MATQVSTKRPFNRLPTKVTPTNYKLFLNTDLRDCKYTGIVTIDVDVHEATKEVVLNSVDTDIKSVTFKQEGSATELQGTIAKDEPNETVMFTFQEPLQNKGILTIEFSGNLTDNLKGYYRYIIKLLLLYLQLGLKRSAPNHSYIVTPYNYISICYAFLCIRF